MPLHSEPARTEESSHPFRNYYLFSPRKSPPTPIGHLGEGAHNVLFYDSTLLIILHYHIREFH
jgi:hypothetical protein